MMTSSSIYGSTKSSGLNTLTYTMDNFPQITNSSQEMSITLEDTRFQLNILPWGVHATERNNYPVDVCVQLRVISSPLLVEGFKVYYKVSILNEASLKALYSQGMCGVW